MSTISERTSFPQVLLIEDNRGDAVLLERAFKRAAVEGKVTIASTAEIALEMLRHEHAFASKACPDIILLDINLPRMSGSEFLKIVKADPVLSLIPVIMMSSSEAELDIHAAYKAAANGFITKPFIPGEYDEVVKTIEDYWFKLNETPNIP